MERSVTFCTCVCMIASTSSVWRQAHCDSDSRRWHRTRAGPPRARTIPVRIHTSCTQTHTHTHILRHRCTHTYWDTDAHTLQTHTATLLEWSQWPTHTLTEWLSSVTLMWTPSIFILRFCCVPVDFEVVNVDSSMASEDDINNAIMAIRRNGVALKGKCFICACLSVCLWNRFLWGPQKSINLTVHWI